MAHYNFKQTSQAALLVSIAAAFPVVAYGAPAARVDFAIGNVTALSPSGQARPLSKGAQLEQGETIATNAGRAQLRFTDGAYVSLQPQSEFRIDQYRFEGKEDGNEKGVFSLIKGGLRTITGLVGRTNKKNYQITTSVATIGIRGTEYTIQYGQSVTGTVGEGEIEVCNGAGCLNVTNGESYYVQNQDAKPELSNKGTDLPPTAPEGPPQKFSENENVDQSGKLCTLFPAQCQVSSGILTGTLSPGNVAYATSLGSLGALQTPATLDASGRLISFNRIGSVTTLSGTFSETGNDGIIAWGHASDSNGGEAIHYAVGIIPSASDLHKSFAGKTGTYTMIGAPTTIGATKVTGATTPTGIFGDQPVGIALTSATLTVDFGAVSNNLAVNMNFSSGGQTVSADAFGSFSGKGSVFSASGSGSGYDLAVLGFFAGANAERAGISYKFDETFVFDAGPVVGTAALARTGLSATALR